jgi:carboxyl-terminal processing protease
MDRAHLPHAYDPGALKFTMSKFYRPSGGSTQLRGVASDIVVPSKSDVSDVNESSLKDALPWDTIPPSPYEAVGRVQPFVNTLRIRSAERVHADRQFGYLAEDMARLKKTSATKSVSLNEAERREQLTEARQKLRDDAARSMLSLGTRAYEITLRNASAPGLPPPEPFVAPSGTSIAPRDEADELSAGSSRREDLTLNEGVRILADYVGLLPG